jgi:hypothetical protein
LLEASAISPEVAQQRNYQSVDTKARLASIDIPKTHQLTPGLLLPVYGPECRNGEASTWQYRPDHPRHDSKGRPVKYVTAMRGMVADVPPAVRPRIGDPSSPLWITEGIRKVDSAITAGIDCIGVLGVWNWRGGNSKGGTTALGAWEHIALNGRDVYLCFDSDVMVKDSVRSALARFTGFLEYRKAVVRLVMLPDLSDGKTGLDDFLAAGGDIDALGDEGRIIWPGELRKYIEANSGGSGGLHRDTPVPIDPVPLADAVATFSRWLHLDDHAPLLVVAAAIVANLEPGDPVWLLIVGPPSGGKTEILSSCGGLPYIVKVATMTEAALLSGTNARDRAKEATGGLLRQVGEFGIILCKDFTSVLSQNRDTAKQAMAALREVYDGSWDRPMGSDGGRVLHWSGKCGLVGGVTPSYDRYGTVVNALGDRFVLLRMPDVAAERQALSALDNGQHEQEMRAELAAAMTGLIAGANGDLVNADLDDETRMRLTSLAMFAARARTAVERDGYSGELLVMPQAEGPARLVKVLRRVCGGLAAIGVEADVRWQLLARIARDCAPAIRVPLMAALVAADEPLRTSDLAETCGLVTKTAHRQLDDLALLGIAKHAKKGTADNSPDTWSASEWLRQFWPPEVGQKTSTKREEEIKEGVSGAAGDGDDGPFNSSSYVSVSLSDRTSAGADTDTRCTVCGGTDTRCTVCGGTDTRCTVCGWRLDPFLAAHGETRHPGCVTG